MRKYQMANDIPKQINYKLINNDKILARPIYGKYKLIELITLKIKGLEAYKKCKLILHLKRSMLQK